MEQKTEVYRPLLEKRSLEGVYAGDGSLHMAGKNDMISGDVLRGITKKYENIQKGVWNYVIYITGDCHGSFERFSKRRRMKSAFLPEKGDYVIVCGDLGLLWAKDRVFEYHLKWLSRLPFTLLWVQGNHENYNMIAEYPTEQWHGGRVRHIVRDKIILLERGQIFHMEGKSFFTFGGASSHDIQGGILDRSSPDFKRDKRRAVQSGLPYRIRNESWWAQELPTDAELQEGMNNLSRAGFSVDYVITHCLSGSMQEKLGSLYGNDARSYEGDILTDYFDRLEQNLQYRIWFCGHYHINLRLDKKHVILYKEVVCPDDFR